ncbi:ABC transporter substrate-binding protein [Paramicrobacterium humi]|uniref:ABC transporter substrate-binding protein n=1 Tax=Paramicrobacterium humi TaxID=640635 RepID=UPI001FDF18E3|nr:extracellular solute-binding protein [Microbacterium humi]
MTVASAALFAVVAALTGCSGGSGGGGQAPENKITEGEWPSYYPKDYGDLVDAAKDEGGELTIYSNTDQENWAPIFRDFKKKYPFITKISANNLDSDEVFQRQLSEMATGNAPADLLVSNAVQAWAKYAEQPDTLMDYKSPELSELPDFAELSPNIFAMSLDPVTISYNTSLFDEAPTGIASLAKIVSADPDKFKGKITTRDVNGAYGFTVSHAFTEGNPDSWDSLEQILPLARPESSSGTQVEKILSGEYAAGFFISTAPAYPMQEKSGGLFDLVFPDDGTVVLGRGIGITPKAPHAATAKLFIDFVLSEEGQNAVAEGGLSSYRDSVKLTEGRHTYQEVVDAVGEDAIIRVPYKVTSDDDVKAFVDRWDGLLGK